MNRIKAVGNIWQDLEVVVPTGAKGMTEYRKMPKEAKGYHPDKILCMFPEQKIALGCFPGEIQADE